MSLVTTHELTCDILVAGGGPAGVPCAVAAAREGAKVVLVQDRPVLGGNSSSEVRMHIVGADVHGGRAIELATEARETGIIEEIRLETSARNPQRSASMLDLVLYELVRNEPNITLLLNTTVVAADVKDGVITHAIADRQSTEDRFRIGAKVFVDCTGDGRLGAEAGAPFFWGRESKEQFQESFGVDKPDRKTLGNTLLFTARKHDRPMPFVAPSWARKLEEKDLTFRGHSEKPDGTGLEYGFWWCEWGGHLDIIKDNEAIRDELMAILMGVWDHIKNGGDHGADNWALEWFGFLPGKRESRRFVGQHVLNENDVLQSKPFDDAIAFGGWPIDLHPPMGVDAPNEKPCHQIKVPHLFDIPLGACVSRDVRNLMFAGRNASATHVAFASTRVMATCAVMGQGVGVAAAAAIKHKLLPAALRENRAVMEEVQQTLLREDCYLVGRTNRDPKDLARAATVTASSEQMQGPATSVLTGQTRAVHGPGGAPEGRRVDGTNRWMSDPAKGLPAWLELRWTAPTTVRQVRLTFDTALARELTLSHSDHAMQKQVWGRPQPETVRDYRILGLQDGQWRELAAVTGNHQRRRVHDLSQPATVEALKVEISATNGLDHARVVEVRVY